MQANEVPFFLGEADVDLYHADTSGNPITTAPVWMGAKAQNMRMDESRESFMQASTGARGFTEYQGNSIHRIEIGRAWVLPIDGGVNKTVMREFIPARNQQFVLQISWVDHRTNLTHQRIYYSVVFRSSNLNSRGALNFEQKQIMSAEWMAENAC